MNDDLLWECAMQDNRSRDRELTYRDIEHHEMIFKQDSCEFNSYENSSCQVNNASSTVVIQEVMGEGVMGLIGGEVWEASLLLAVYMLKNEEFLSNRRILELGSGTGLPLLFFLTFCCLRNTNCDIIFSDNDSEILSNLVVTLREHYSSKNECSPSHCKVRVEHLDWSDFSSNKGLSEKCKRIAPHAIVGSALCYSFFHTCLADTLKYFLDTGTSTVDIIQIKDRPGFEPFLQRLTVLNITYTIESVSEDIYVQAQEIQCNLINICCIDSMDSNKVIQVKGFRSPLIHSETSNVASHGNLIRTNRESFVLLKIRRDDSLLIPSSPC